MSRSEPTSTTFEVTGAMLAPMKPFVGPQRWMKTSSYVARLRVTDHDIALSARGPFSWFFRGVPIPLDEVIAQEVDGVLTLRRRGQREWPMEFYTRHRTDVLAHLARAGAEIDTTSGIVRHPSTRPRYRRAHLLFFGGFMVFCLVGTVLLPPAILIVGVFLMVAVLSAWGLRDWGPPPEDSAKGD